MVARAGVLTSPATVPQRGMIGMEPSFCGSKLCTTASAGGGVEPVQPRVDDGICDRQPKIIAKKLLAIAAAELIIVRAEAALEEAAKGVEQPALECRLRGIVDVGGS